LNLGHSNFLATGDSPKDVNTFLSSTFEPTQDREIAFLGAATVPFAASAYCYLIFRFFPKLRSSLALIFVLAKLSN